MTGQRRQGVVLLAAVLLVTSGGGTGGIGPVEITIAGDVGVEEQPAPDDVTSTPAPRATTDSGLVEVGPARPRPVVTPRSSPTPTPVATEVVTPTPPPTTSAAPTPPPADPVPSSEPAPVVTEAAVAAPVTPTPSHVPVTPTPTPEPPPSQPPTEPPPPPPDAWRTIHGSLQTRTVTLPGPVVVHETRWLLGDPGLRIRTDTAAVGGGRATVAEAASARGALMAVNGGFWVDDDDPDGWLLTDGRLRSDTTGGRNWKRNLRGGIGFGVDARAIIGVPTWDANVRVEGERRTVRGVARRPIGTGDVVLFPHGTWSHPPVPAGGLFLRVPVPGQLDVTQTVTLPVFQAASTPPRLDDPDTLIVWFDEAAAAGLERDPDELTLDMTVAEGWSGMEQGLAAGPWILERGISTGASQWRSEGFTAAHTDRRHPRSAIGLTEDGHAVVTVVDGRQPGWSIGFTVPELTDHLAGQGVVDAVMLDGGGSSQLVVGGGLVNRPCCDGAPRRVATVLLVEPA